MAAYVDGEANVTLSDQPFPEQDIPVFSGNIITKNKYISLVDTSTNYYCILRLLDDIAEINIWNVSRGDSELSWVQFNNLDLF